MYSFVDRVPPKIDSPAYARLDDNSADEDEGEVARVALEQVLVDPVAGAGGFKSVHPVCEEDANGLRNRQTKCGTMKQTDN